MHTNIQSPDYIQNQRKTSSMHVHHQNSDELIRLKLAYEKACNFNEKPIQTQITKIRLGRLFRSIKEKFSNSKSTRLASPRLMHESKDQIRREELAKARQLGVYYCQQNFDIPWDLLTDMQETQRSLEGNPRKRLERRLLYGNMTSRRNISKTNRSKTMHSKESTSHPLPNGENFAQGKSLDTKNHLQVLQKTMSRDGFIKTLISCLSADNPNPDDVKAIKDSMLSKSGIYEDLLKAIEQSQLYIKRYRKFLTTLSNIASNLGEEELEPSVENFESKTSFKPRYSCSSEILLGTYRYTDDGEFLPPPSESLLRIPELQADPDDVELQREKIVTESLVTLKKSLSHLSTKLEMTLRTQANNRNTLTNKFGDFNSDTVQKGSVPLLANLEVAIKH